MKKVVFVFLIAFAFVACKNEKKEVETDKTSETETSTEMEEPTEYVWWKGSKVIGGNHHGKAMFSNVDIKVEEGKLTGGEFVIDLNSITTDDLEGKKAEDLIGHLKSEDFFEVKTYPNATFKIMEVKHPEDGGTEGHEITGNLTIKDVTKTITVPATIEVTNDGKVNMESEFTIDRSEYNVNYGSPTKFTDIAKDKAIKDEVELKVVINS